MRLEGNIQRVMEAPVWPVTASGTEPLWSVTTSPGPARNRCAWEQHLKGIITHRCVPCARAVSVATNVEDRVGDDRPTGPRRCGYSGQGPTLSDHGRQLSVGRCGVA